MAKTAKSADVSVEEVAGIMAPEAEPVPEAEPEPRLSQGMGGLGPFPAAFLLAGDSARRAEWGPGFEIVAANAMGRSGQRMALMTTGHRAGLIEWKPVHLADELLAQDWIVIPAVARDPLP